MRHAEPPHDRERGTTSTPRPPAVFALLVMHAAQTDEVVGSRSSTTRAIHDVMNFEIAA